jgi:hypothetical protein
MKTTLAFQLPAEEFPQALATPFSHLHLVIASTFKRNCYCNIQKKKKKKIGH